MTARNGYIREDRRWQAHLARCERVRVRHRGADCGGGLARRIQMSESVSSNGASGLRPQALVWWRMARWYPPPDFPRFEWEPRIECGAALLARGEGGARFRENNHARC